MSREHSALSTSCVALIKEVLPMTRVDITNSKDSIHRVMEVNNGNEADSMKKIEKQSNPKVMNLL